MKVSSVCGSSTTVHSGSGRSSVASTHALRAARSSSTAAMPDFPIPATTTVLPSSVVFHLSFSVVSANSAITSPAIQKRAMIFDSCQPSASK